MFKHFLICPDGSTLGNKGARAGIELARALHAKATAYCAIEQLQLIYGGGHMIAPGRGAPHAAGANQ